MEEVIFSGISYIEIQGDKVLKVLEVLEDCARYEVIGFTKPRIEVVDYRKAPLEKLNEVLSLEASGDFSETFNVPAKILIKRNKSGNLEIKLSESEETFPNYRLWVAVGMENKVPNYKFLVEEINFMKEGRIAFLALYKILMGTRKGKSKSSYLSAG